VPASFDEIADPVAAALDRQQARPTRELGVVRQHLHPQVQEQFQPAWPGERLEHPPEMLRERGRRPRSQVGAVGRAQGENAFELLRSQDVARGRSQLHRRPAALADRQRGRRADPFRRRWPEQRDQESGAVAQAAGVVHPQDPHGGENRVPLITARAGQAGGAEARAEVDSCTGHGDATELDQPGQLVDRAADLLLAGVVRSQRDRLAQRHRRLVHESHRARPSGNPGTQTGRHHAARKANFHPNHYRRVEWLAVANFARERSPGSCGPAKLSRDISRMSPRQLVRSGAVFSSARGGGLRFASARAGTPGREHE
jgi:hypothetical protein